VEVVVMGVGIVWVGDDVVCCGEVDGWCLDFILLVVVWIVGCVVVVSDVVFFYWFFLGGFDVVV